MYNIVFMYINIYICVYIVLVLLLHLHTSKSTLSLLNDFLGSVWFVVFRTGYFFGDLAISSGLHSCSNLPGINRKLKQLPPFAHTELGDDFRMSLCFHCMPGVSIMHSALSVCIWNLERCLSPPLKHNPHAETHHAIHQWLGNLNKSCKFNIAFSIKNSTCKSFVPAFVYHSRLLVCNTSSAVTLRSFTSWASSWGAFGEPTWRWSQSTHWVVPSPL